MKGKTLLLSLFKTKKMSGKAKALTAFTALFLGGFFVVHTLLAAVTVTPATGGTNISIDTSSMSAGHAWTSLGNVRFSESSAGEISAGVHSIEAPAGWEFNTSANVSAAATGGNGFTLASGNILPTANQVTFTVTSASTAPVDLNFNGIQIRPTGTVAPASTKLTHSGASINGVVDGSTSLGDLSVVPGASNKVVIETAADGSGSAVSATSITADQALHVYSVERDQFNNFKGNVVSTWTMPNVTGSVMAGDLVADGDNKGAILTGNLVGTGIIHAVDGGFTNDSGIITVTAGAPASLNIDTQPSSASSVDLPLSVQPIISVRDADTNLVSGAHVIASLASGSGALRGTLDVTTNAGGVATFTDLGYNKLDSFTIKFTVNALNTTSNALTVTVGAATKVNVETAADGSGSTVSAQDLASGSALTVYGITRDQFDNFVANPATSVFSIVKTGGVVNGDLVDSSDHAVLTGNLVGTATIHVTNPGLTSGDSGLITIINGPAAKFVILNPADNTVENNVVVAVQLQDTNGNIVTTGPDKDKDVTLVATGSATGEGVVNITNGIGTLSLNDHTAETVNLSLIDIPVSGFNVASTQDVIFSHGAIHHFNVMGATDPVVAGTASDVTVTAKDIYDNTVTDYVGTISFSSTDALAVLPANYTFVGGDMGTYNFMGGVTLKTVGEKIVTASSGAITGSQANITVTPAAPVKVNVETAADGSGSIVSAQDLASASSLTVYSITRDQFDNFVGNEASTWTLTSKTGGVADANLVAAGNFKSATLTGNLVGTGIIHVTNGALTAGNSGIITVINGPATKFIILDPTDDTVDNNVTVTVQLQDINSNIVTVGADKDKDVTLNADGSATGDTVVDIMNGVGTLSLNDHVAETVHLTLSDSASTGFNIASTQDLIFSHGAANKYVITNPTDGTVDASIHVTVTLQDQYANTITTGADKDKDVILNVGGSATGAGTVNITNGVGSLNINDHVAETVNLTLSNILPTSFNVSSAQDLVFAHGVATKYSIIDPTDGTVDAPILVTVKLQDQYGNTVTTGLDANKDVTLNTDGSATGAGIVFIASGVGALNISDHVAETVNLSLTDSQLTGFNVVSSVENVVFAHGAMHHFSVTGITDPVVAGTPTSPVVTAQDQYDNTVTNYNDTVHFSATDIHATLPADYLFIGGNNGSKAFTNQLIIKAAGEQTITVTDGTFSGSQANITVNPAVIDYLSVTASPVSLSISMPSTITVSGYDVYDNLVTNNNTTPTNGTRVFVHAGGNANLDTASKTLVSGQATFVLNSMTAGSSLVDAFTNSPVTTPGEVTVTFLGDVVAPTITMNATPVQSITQTSAVIAFKSSETGLAKVHYGLTDSYGNVTAYQAVTANTDKTIAITGLSCGTIYNYSVYAKDSAGNETAGSNATFATSACTANVIPTVSLNGTAVVSAYSLTEANARFASGLRFDTTNASNITVNGASISPAATITAANLATATSLGAHSYNVVVTSATGHTASMMVTYQVNADNIAPVLPTISLLGATILPQYDQSAANVRFASGVQFALTNNSSVTINGTPATNAATITAATNNEAKSIGVHSYNVIVMSSTGHTASLNISFSVVADLDLIAPVVTPNVTPVQNVTQTSANIVFQSNENGYARVHYGLTSAYGNVTSDQAVIANANKTITVAGLTCGTNYQFRITALDAAGNMTDSNGVGFTTLACTPGDTTAPSISHNSMTQVTPAQITAAITFQSNEAGSAKIHYGLSNSYGNVTDYEAVSANTNKVITLTALTCGTTYHYAIYAMDGSNNEAHSSDMTFATTACAVGDIIAPTVTAQTPVDGSLSQLATVAPMVTFSEAMNASTVNASTVQLRKYSDDSVVSAVVTLNGAGTIATISPVTSLSANTHYYIYVSGAKDLAGNDVAAYTVKANQEFTTATANTGTFGIISNIMTKMTGIADDSYANGWEWLIRMTLPTDQNSFALKFNDWVSGSNTLAAGSNMEYYSDQISSGTGSSAAPVAITTANMYPANVTVNNDADANMDGIQTDVHVRVKLPISTQNGSYSTSYRVNYGM